MAKPKKYLSEEERIFDLEIHNLKGPFCGSCSEYRPDTGRCSISGEKTTADNSAFDCDSYHEPIPPDTVE
jgi:hypothetical protein